MQAPSHHFLLATAGLSLLLFYLAASKRRSTAVIASHTALEEPEVPPPAPRTDTPAWALHQSALAAEVAKAKASGVCFGPHCFRLQCVKRCSAPGLCASWHRSWMASQPHGPPCAAPATAGG
jgi:hypothetical protein